MPGHRRGRQLQLPIRRHRRGRVTDAGDMFRAVREPFSLPDDWNPIFGHCSRCGNPAVLNEDRWWHDGKGCDPRKAGPAEFIPDPQ